MEVDENASRSAAREVPPKDMQNLDHGPCEKPALAHGKQREPDYMGQELNFESYLETEVNGHIANQLKPPAKKKVKEEEERIGSYSEGKGKNNGEPRKYHQ